MERKAKQLGIKLSYVRNGKRYRKTDKQLYNAINGKLKVMAFGYDDDNTIKEQAKEKLLELVPGLTEDALKSVAETSKNSKKDFNTRGTLATLGLLHHHNHVERADLSMEVYYGGYQDKTVQGAPYREIFGYLPETSAATGEDILKFARFYQYIYPEKMSNKKPTDESILNLWADANS